MRQYQIIAKEQPTSTVTEQYRKLRTNIDFTSIDKDIKVINFTSSFPKEGKTLTCLNVATVYSQSNKKTLIIDLDLRKPKIHRSFQVSNKVGINDYITGSKPIQNCITNVGENLDILPSGEKIPFPAEALMSKKMKVMIEELRKEYDKIIIDCPPLTAVTDATIISKYSDGTIFVVASRKTNNKVAKRVIKELKDSGAPIIGGVMTQTKKKDAFYGMNYYYYYGE